MSRRSRRFPSESPASGIWQIPLKPNRRDLCIKQPWVALPTLATDYHGWSGIRIVVAPQAEERLMTHRHIQGFLIVVGVLAFLGTSRAGAQSTTMPAEDGQWTMP